MGEKNDDHLTPRELLFEYALSNSDEPPPSRLTLLSLLTNTLEGMPNAEKGIAPIMRWFRVVLEVVGQDATPLFLREFCQGLNNADMNFVLRFVGVPTSGRNKLTSARGQFLVNLTVATARHVHECLGAGTESTDPLQDSGLIKDLLFRSSERENPERGFLVEDQATMKAMRPCRFCKALINQVHDRKKVKVQDAESSLGPNVMAVTDPVIISDEPISISTSDTSVSDNEGCDVLPQTPEEVVLNVHTQFYRRKTFCNTACIFLYRLASSSSAIREAVFVRDQGVCASCGHDTMAFMKRVITLLTARTAAAREATPARSKELPFSLEHVAHAIFDASPLEWRHDDMVEASDILVSKKGPLYELYARASRRLLKTPSRECFRKYPRFGFRQGDIWQADHIVPVSLRGGVSPLLISFRTLCFVCHRLVTSRLMALKPEKVPKTKNDENGASQTATQTSRQAAISQPSTKAQKRRKVGRWYRRL
eukprot:Blabericola_migrator_1__7748@NODE_395_length_8977_cov_183_416835_g72_i1_p2_GENE_NODE_395_length_8977_cov_183_416835_g72_i1NODE_395_length_8977_cov_183_416835_g72_i1_p2_ORF_typecomplete_len481_score39_57HNH/PF01844_23/5_8e03HNH/PF01844_23/1_2e04HNH/PF01844_23/0_0023Bd3614deam/PF14439_6/0_12NosL/PF05573_12/0_42_NODE_395_length_8977_cov_183_416835_g72_i143565798